MRDLTLRMDGALGFLVAVAHGLIAELRVFPNAHIEPRRTRRRLANGSLRRMDTQPSATRWPREAPRGMVVDGVRVALAVMGR
jgi:hypothetical protein